MKIKSTKLLAMLLAVFMLFSFSSVALAATIEVDVELIEDLNATLTSKEKYALLEDVYAKLGEQGLLDELDAFETFYSDAVKAQEEDKLDAFFAKENVEDMKNVFDATMEAVENSPAQTEIITTVVGVVVDSDDIPDEKKTAIVEIVTEYVDMTEIIANVYDKAYAQADAAGYVAKAVAGLEIAIDGLDFVADYAAAYGLLNIDVKLLIDEIELMQKTIADVVEKIEAGDFETYEEMVATVSGMKTDIFEHYENIVDLGREVSVILNPYMSKLINAVSPLVEKVGDKVAPYAPEKVDAVVAKFNQIKYEIDSDEMKEKYKILLSAATHTKLDICGNTVDYVALGGNLTVVDNSYADLFEEALENACAQTLVNKPALTLEGNLTAENVAKYIEDNLTAIQNAELITFNMDATGTAAVMIDAFSSVNDEWRNHADAETIALAEKIYARVYDILVEKYGTEKVEKIGTLAENLVYVAATYGIETFKALETIADNTSAKIAVVGMVNPFVGTTIVYNDETIDVGKLFDYVIEVSNCYYETYAILSGKVIFVSAAGAETVGKNTSTQLVYTDGNGMLSNENLEKVNTIKAGAYLTANGHAEVYEALCEAIAFSCTCSSDPYIPPVTPGGSVEDSHFWCDGGENCYCNGYEDLDNTMWYHQGVCYMIKNGLMIGIGDSKWAPNQIITRAEIATILWRLAGSEVVDFTLDFEDVEADMWYTEAIRWAVSEGIYLGYPDHKFGPNDQITREQLVTVMYRYELMDGETLTADFDLTTLSDADEISDWAVEAMTWAFDTGLIIGTDVDVLTASPLKTATRAEAAMIFYRKLDGLLK